MTNEAKQYGHFRKGDLGYYIYDSLLVDKLNICSNKWLTYERLLLHKRNIYHKIEDFLLQHQKSNALLRLHF